MFLLNFILYFIVSIFILPSHAIMDENATSGTIEPKYNIRTPQNDYELAELEKEFFDKFSKEDSFRWDDLIAAPNDTLKWENLCQIAYNKLKTRAEVIVCRVHPSIATYRRKSYLVFMFKYNITSPGIEVDVLRCFCYHTIKGYESYKRKRASTRSLEDNDTFYLAIRKHPNEYFKLESKMKETGRKGSLGLTAIVELLNSTDPTESI